MTTPSDASSTRQLTVRLAPSTLRAAQRAARARGVSVNALVRELLLDLDRQEQERSLRAMYEQLGADADASVEHATRAQAEIARRG